MKDRTMTGRYCAHAWAHLAGVGGLCLTVALCLTATAAAQAPAAPPLLPQTEAATAAATAPGTQAGQLVDGIAAIVNKDVITLRELRSRTEQIRTALTRQRIAPPAQAVLQRQVLQRLIAERVENQEAARLNVRIGEAQIDQAIAAIAARNSISVAQMRRQIEADTSWDEYRRDLHRDLLHDRMRQVAIDHTLFVSDVEVDAYLKEREAQRASPASQAATQAAAGPEILTLAQILVRVPEGASPEQLAQLRRRAEALHGSARANSDFAALAAATSDGAEAPEGGVLGARPVDGWPELFLAAIGSQGAGFVTEIIQSGNGFHILKVVERSRAGADTTAHEPSSVPVTQTHARHILIKTSAVVSDEQARQRLEQLRQRIAAGESFADLARRFSADVTAPQGGDLGWVNPGETVPAFAEAMDALAEGEVSAPVQSPFGWHLITVEARRVQDMAQELLRVQARQTLFERRAQPAFENWLAQLHDQAYIDNRLEKRQQLEQSL